MFDYQKLTATIIAQIEKGADKWQMPWHRDPVAGTADLTLPVNAATGANYQGANIIVFWSTAKAMRYASHVWATYKQWQSIGAQVRKGETGTYGIKWTAVKDKRDPDRMTLIPCGFTVFNAAQVDGWSGELPKAQADKLVDLVTPAEKADALVADSGAHIQHGGTRAFYAPSLDVIGMPDRFRFGENSQGYYSTLLHELTHWTGAKSRCDRDFSGRFGSDAYAFEELVAELGAAFLCALTGVSNEPRPDHASYLASWLKVLKADPKALVTAASKAQAAVNYIMSASTPDEVEAPEELPLAA
jgi:antirestriction protein ArdC